jgi:hypothetical protein
MRVLGVDCGLSGAVAVVEINNGVAQLIDAADRSPESAQRHASTQSGCVSG